MFFFSRKLIFAMDLLEDFWHSATHVARDASGAEAEHSAAPEAPTT